MKKSLLSDKNRAIFGWALYDWANSAFVLTVMTAFFPIFFRKFWCAGLDPGFTTTKLGLGNAVAGLCIAVLSPFLGALADAGKQRKKLLLSFMTVGVILTALFPLIGVGQWRIALALFITTSIAWACANLFYDSLLPVVAPPKHLDFVSSLGYSVGYLGCAVLFAINIVLVNKPAFFGLHDTTEAVKISFVSVSGWWMVFSLPLLLFVKENGTGTKRQTLQIMRQGMRQLTATLREILHHRHIWLFLIAYWLYIDGVDTFVRMAADLGMSIGLDAGSLMVSLLIVQIVAFPSALLFGLLSQRIGARTSILIGIGIYILITVIGPLWVKTDMQFRLLAAISALPLGCLQALSRSYYARIIPVERAAQYFGFYNLMGKFAAILGPAMVALVAFVAQRTGMSCDSAARIGFCSITVLFICGAVFLVLAGSANKDAKFPAK